MLHVHCTGSGTQEPSIASSACADSALLIMSRVVRNNRFVVPLPAEEHKCSKRRDQKCKTLWGGYADDPGTDGARHWAKWRGDRAEATGQRARPKADGQSCTLATPRGSSIRVPIGRLSPEAFSRGVFASGRETRSGRFFLGPQWCPTELVAAEPDKWQVRPASYRKVSGYTCARERRREHHTVVHAGGSGTNPSSSVRTSLLRVMSVDRCSRS